MNSSHPSRLQVWVPNLFEFKGGIQVYLTDVLRAIETQFPLVPVTIIDKLDRHRPVDQLLSEQFSFRFSGRAPSPLQTLHFVSQIVQTLLVQNPDLILCGHLNFAPVVLWVHQLLGIPYWLVVYGIDAWNVTDPAKVKALHQAELILSISSYTRKRLVQEQQLPEDRIDILPVTFNADRFSLGPKPDYLLQRYRLQANQPVLLTVARLADSDRFKGYDQVLKALPQIRQTLPDIHYLIVGKGRDRPRIEKLIQDLDLQDCVTLTGFVPDDELGDHYNLCDVFAMPSKREGFGIVYLEALACGKPALGGNQDGAMDALCSGKLGALVDPDDIEAIAEFLIQMLQGKYPNPLMYQPEALRQAVIDTYGIEAFQRRLAGLLREQGMSL
jgi:glycosyltransferase involved in cell wall biosynthesis